MNPHFRTDLSMFKGVTTDDKFEEAIIRQQLREEKEQLDRDKAQAEQALKEFEEKVKIEKAKRLFTEKPDFLMREQLDRMENFVVKLNKFLMEGDPKAISRAMKDELWNIRCMNIYLASSSGTDILYDFKGANIYKKIKENNVDSSRTNERLGQIEVRETDWLHFPSKESGDKSSGDN